MGNAHPTRTRMKTTEIERYDMISRLVEARRLLRSLQAGIREIQTEINAELRTDCSEAARAGAILAGHIEDLTEIAMGESQK
jgi:hypothetical protein